MWQRMLQSGGEPIDTNTRWEFVRILSYQENTGTSNSVSASYEAESDIQVLALSLASADSGDSTLVHTPLEGYTAKSWVYSAYPRSVYAQYKVVNLKKGESLTVSSSATNSPSEATHGAYIIEIKNNANNLSILNCANVRDTDVAKLEVSNNVIIWANKGISTVTANLLYPIDKSKYLALYNNTTHLLVSANSSVNNYGSVSIFELGDTP